MRGSDRKKLKKASKSGSVFEVYSIDRAGAKKVHYAHPNLPDAQKHVSELKKMYGKYAKLGIEQKTKSRYAFAVQKCMDVLADLKKCR